MNTNKYQTKDNTKQDEIMNNNHNNKYKNNIQTEDTTTYKPSVNNNIDNLKIAIYNQSQFPLFM